jgi:1-acyl-sn-glycerol-3-phosphate acyltransferase
VRAGVGACDVVDPRKGSLMEPIYAGIAGSLIAWMRAMDWSIEISGIERIPPQGGAVVATNHVGYLDWLFVGLAGRRRGRNIRFVAKRELWERPFTRAIMSGARHIPADRYGSPGVAVQRAVDALRAGEVVGMFPEATINRSFLPSDGKTGAVRMAMEAGVPLVPGAVWGSQRLLTKGRPRDLRRGVAIDVRFGAPVPCAAGDDPVEVTGQLMLAPGRPRRHRADRGRGRAAARHRGGDEASPFTRRRPGDLKRSSPAQADGAEPRRSYADAWFR